MVLLLSLLLLPVSLLRFLSLWSKQRTEGEEGSEEPTVNGVRNRSLENAPPLALISSKNPVETGSRGEPKIKVGARSRLATTKKNSKWPPCVACRAVKKMWQLRCTATKRRQKKYTCQRDSCARARATYLLVFLFQGELLLFDNLELVAEVELGGLLLQLGEFVLVLGDLLQRRLDAVRKSKRLYTEKDLHVWSTYNLPRRSLTWALRSEI